MSDEDIRTRLGLRPIVNVSGTMTALGASIMVPEAIDAMRAIMPQFVEIDALQAVASRIIARICGSEAGFVTASSAAGLTLALAAAMTGDDLHAIEMLPDTSRLRNEVPIMTGHLVEYGAPVDQAIRLAGARPVPVGQATSCHAYQLQGALTDRTAAILFVVSHHTVQTGQLPLAEVCAIAARAGVPVIVDAASEYDLRGFLAAGAAVAVYSAHKFLGGPTGGIVAGRKPLIRAAFLHNRGIGRGMKAGKETVAGTIAALEAWEVRDHRAVRARERRALDLWHGALSGLPGIAVSIIPDPTGNPLDRLKISVDPGEAGITAWSLAEALEAGSPPIFVRDHEVELGFFVLDPCNLHPGEEQVVASRIVAELGTARRSGRPGGPDFATWRRSRTAPRWPD